MDSVDWKDRLRIAIAEDCIADLVEVLESQVTAHAGTASAKVKRLAIRELLTRYGTSDERVRVADALCNSGSDTGAEVAALVYAAGYDANPNYVARQLCHLADRPHWEVREWAASAAGDVLEHHFSEFHPIVTTWTKDASENVRRAALLALMYAGRSRNPTFAGPILDALEPLLSDTSKYVSNNLGPFALGAGLARYYPEDVVARLHQWVTHNDEQVRWNLAMMFSAADGAKLAARAQQVLDTLVADERPKVRRAVTKALKNVRARGLSDVTQR
ncbi:DNA alkylation repair protein [Alicyclobacillus sp. ALC3]|uniref:DNA alkylation repair protein n=1 Tax=Alicyclobacillus sp. ALC3 TaxID=2796143 RepID=UPI002379A727|nr:DNA alkylation repair protein [Alicyclobacillus sp. ALC3]WDL96028.1 DNA alkylation repair protein [Alicyclobacillus sp. ALC3]